MKPGFYMGLVLRIPFTGSFKAFLLIVVCIGLANISGCGSTSNIVKKDSVTRFVASAQAGSNDKGVVTKGQKGKSTARKARKTLNSYPEIPMDKNGPRVRRFIREYAYRDRATMKKYLARAEEYLPMVKSIAEEQGLPEEIAYLFMLESGANPEARSQANAVGMWQFMPATARSYGLRVDSWVDERLDPHKSTKAAMLYLKDLYGMFGCWRLALSAYNSGENKLNRVLCKEDADEYDQICTSKYLRRETKEFWPRFQAIAQISQNPEKYGFTPVYNRQYRPSYEMVTLGRCYALASLAKAVGVPSETLETLNPALVRSMTPPNGPHYSLKVPVGRKSALLARLNSVDQAKSKGRHVIHVVHRGDNLKRILKRYRVTRDELANVNPDVNLHRRLRRGERILIPVKSKTTNKTSRSTRRVTLL